MKKAKEKPEIVCAYCEDKFKQSRPWSKYCSALCSGRAHAEKAAVTRNDLKTINDKLKARIAELEAKQ